MFYYSSRDNNKNKFSFSDILLQGLANDGGLFVPEEYPKIDLEQLKHLSGLSYQDLAFSILSLFIGDSIPSSDLKEIINAAYTEEKFNHPEICPSHHLYENIYIQDLSSGPSLAFKDMAMQFLGQVMQYELNRRHESLTIVGASSGDTVSSAEEALKSKPNIKVVMLTPQEGMSAFQKAQAGSILDANIFNLSIPQPFDTCQDIVKQINNDLAFKKKYSIGAVNSINWSRIAAQIVYYFKGYFSVIQTIGEPLDVCVPSGNFGNCLAAYIAKQMGLPLRELIVATNENNVLEHFFNTGLYKQQSVTITSSPSMDISKASNIERFFCDLLDRDGAACKKLMTKFETEKEIDLSQYLNYIQKDVGFRAGKSTHEDRLTSIRKVYKESNIIIDPHTAAAVHVAEQLSDKTCPILCMETAKPTKFEDCIHEALGFIPERLEAYKNIETKKQRFYTINANDSDVKKFIETHVC
jgi:threonine synthase